jgi:hypothetical protein
LNTDAPTRSETKTLRLFPALARTAPFDCSKTPGLVFAPWGNAAPQPESTPARATAQTNSFTDTPLAHTGLSHAYFTTLFLSAVEWSIRPTGASMQDYFAAFFNETMSVPLADALVMLASFLAIGFLMVWKDPRPITPLLLMKLLAAWTFARYFDSYVIFHHALIEGVWPIIWTAGGILGVAAGQWANRRDRNTPTP